jgi:DNA-binding HxlR family transcriptional regulator
MTMTEIHRLFAPTQSVTRRTLHHLASYGVPTPIRRVAERMPQTSHQRVYQAINALHERGLVQRHDIPDEPAYRWSVTPAGREFLRSREGCEEATA